MLTDKELDQIRAIVRAEIYAAAFDLDCRITNRLGFEFSQPVTAAPDLSAPDMPAPDVTPDVTPTFDPDSMRIRLERMAEIDTRNDERIAAWQARKEEEP